MPDRPTYTEIEATMGEKYLSYIELLDKEEQRSGRQGGSLLARLKRTHSPIMQEDRKRACVICSAASGRAR